MAFAASKQGSFEDILIPGEDWQLVGSGYRFSEGTAVDIEGTVYFNDIQASRGFRIHGGSVVEWCQDTNKALGQTFGIDGKTLISVSWGVPEVIRTTPDGKRTVFVSGLYGNDIVCHSSSNLYLTNPPAIDASRDQVSRIWLIEPDGKPVLVHEGIQFANGIALSPDGKLLYVNNWKGREIYRFQVKRDGSLAAPEVFILLDVPTVGETAGSDGMRVDFQGRIWVATKLGIQVFDSSGMKLGILEGPEDRCSHLVFGGPEFNTLYLTTVKAIYKRTLKVRGMNPWDETKN